MYLWFAKQLSALPIVLDGGGEGKRKQMCLGTVQNNRAQCDNSLNCTQLSSSSEVLSAGLILFMVIELNCLTELQLHFYYASNIYTCPSFQVQSAS